MTTEAVEVPQASWLDQTFRVAENADVEIELQPTGAIEYSVLIPEMPTSRLTLIVPAPVARKINEKVRELLAVVPVLIAALIS